jgi:hypothetical protein
LASAIIGGVINCIVNSGHINSFGDGLKYFGVGCVSGAGGGFAGAQVGAAFVSSSFISGATAGAAAGAASGFVAGSGNALVGGSSFGQSMRAGLSAGEIGAAGGAILGGLNGGLDAQSHNRNFWDGHEYPQSQSDYEYSYASNNTGRPDDDGVITRDEANRWRIVGHGQPLNADASKVDLAFVSPSDFDYKVNKSQVIQTLWDSKDGEVYGNLTMKYLGGHEVEISPDVYNFEMHSWSNPINWIRNFATWYGNPGNGQDFIIRFYNHGIIGTDIWGR